MVGSSETLSITLNGPNTSACLELFSLFPCSPNPRQAPRTQTDVHTLSHSRHLRAVPPPPGREPGSPESAPPTNRAAFRRSRGTPAARPV